mgnify:CR=1 FL=1
MRKMRKGFTLVELLIVIAILGVLGTIMSLSGTNATTSADAAKIVNDLRAVRTAAMQFYFDYPDTHSQVKGENGWEKDATGAEKLFSSVLANYVDTTLGATTTNYALRIVGTTATITAANAEWYVCYLLPSDTSTVVKARLAGQAESYGLKGTKATTADSTTTIDELTVAPGSYTNAASGQEAIAIRVR